MGELSASCIVENEGVDEWLSDADLQSSLEVISQIANQPILQLKNNFIPKGLVPLEQIFGKNVIPVKPDVHPKEEDVKDFHIKVYQAHHVFNYWPKIVVRQFV